MNEMKASVGQFVIAKTCFCEDAEKLPEEQRSKPRPLLVLAAMVAPNNEFVYLCAKVSSQTQKCHGDIEVRISEENAKLVGMVKEGVCRFNRSDLVAIRESQIRHYLGGYLRFPYELKNAIRAAARLANCPL